MQQATSNNQAAPNSAGAAGRSGSTVPVFLAEKSLETFRLAKRVANTDVAVLITGESGTGKEVVARYIHQHSARAPASFVAMNCAAIPESMLESLLFGHERGAFTGAVQARQGKFVLANGGTLLLDEISEMPVALQAKLLRVLQEQEVEPLGSKMPIAVNARVLATSNRDLPQAVAAGEFREDLYYRLNVFPLRLAPLRERVEDVMPLARAFFGKYANIAPTIQGFSDACQRAMLAYTWPGNVRELENSVQRSLVVAEGGWIEEHDLGLPNSALSDMTIKEAQVDMPAPQTLAQYVERAEFTAIEQALHSCSGQKKKAAQILQISERTLRYKLARLRNTQTGAQQ